MNLLSMIEAASNAAAIKPATDSTLHEIRLRNLRLGGPSQRTRAIERYKEVMAGNGWLTQTQIENALGYGSCVASLFLRKLLEMKMVTRRNRGDSKVFKRREGYEWRWQA